MATVAEQLREARAARNLTVQQVADITKLRTDHVRALEEGNFDVFTAPVYIRGFVRTYSTLLKLDVREVMATLDRELGQTQKFDEPPPLSDSPRGVVDSVMLQLSKIDWRRAAIGLGAFALVLAAISAVLAWRHHQKTDPLAGLPPGLYQPTQHVSGETLPIPGAAPKR